MTTLRVAVAQLAVRVGDMTGNAAAIAEAMSKAESAHADVLLTPEMSVTGYPVEDLLAEREFIDTAREHARTLAGASTGTITILGAPFRATDLPAAGRAAESGFSLDAHRRLLRNVAVLAQNGQIVGAHSKSLLPNYSVFDDARHFAPGTTRQAAYITQTPDGPVRFAVLVCEDVWEVSLAQGAASQGADVILVINASPYHVGKPAQRLNQLRAAAKKSGLPIVYCNAVGGQDEIVFDGGSLVVTPDGQVLARAASFQDDFFVVDVPVAKSRVMGSAPVELASTYSHRPPLADPPVTEPMEVHAEVWAALVRGFKDYCERVGLPKIVLGLSGGIDSALAAVIAVDALGPDAVWGIGMPGPYSSEGSVTDAQVLAENLGIQFDVVPIRDAYLERETVLKGLLTDRNGSTGHPVAWENLQARLRGTTLMTISNATGALVCTTGNRSESAVGYFTLYGDSCGTAPNPLGDLLKTTVEMKDGTVLPGVYGLSEWRNAQAVASGRVAPIPVSTITKPASAELAPDQVDSDSLPPYPVLDRLLLAFLEDHTPASDLAAVLVAEGYDSAVAVSTVNRVLALVDRSEFKRRQVPIRIKVSRLAFGRDRRMPLANHWSHATAKDAESALV